MSRIGAKNTKPEIRLRKALWARGLRYRLHASTPVGRPDLVFKGPRIAIFVDGCFWHGCPAHYVRPRSRADFWGEKLRANVERDRRQTLELEETGWTVLRIWEHQIEASLQDTTDSVVELVRNRAASPHPSWRVVEVQPLNGDDKERRILERLRDPEPKRVIEQKRSTAKWKRSVGGS